MKNKIISICVGILFIVGLGLLLYPSVSNWVNERNQSRVVAGYQDAVADMTEKDYTEYLEAAREHNKKIAQAGSLGAAVHMENEDNLEEYNSLLNIRGNGVMGIIRIPKIDVQLPIYHTTRDTVLQVGIGHYPGSSLPVGGEGTHCVVSGHTGLPSAKLFTDVDQLAEGDVFYMDILGDTLAYQVDQIQTVLPEKVESLDITPGEDYVTLVTCTPYGINSHRLLIRGTRIPYVPEEEVQAVESAVSERKKRIPAIAIFAVAAFTVAIVAGKLFGNRRNDSEKRRRKE